MDGTRLILAKAGDRIMSRSITVILIAFLSLGTRVWADGNVDLPRYPSISPDGSTVVFSWRGDLFSAPIGGGQVSRLTSHPGRDHRSAWLPGGEGIVFESDRDGTRNLYRMQPDGSQITSITDTDAAIFLNNVGADSEGNTKVAITGYLEGDVYRDARSYELNLEGGQPKRIHNAFGRSAVRSPDGSTVAFVRGASSWDRRHYRGPDARNVWLFHPKDGSFTQLTTWEGNDGRPRWAGSDHVMYLSDREGDTTNLYRHSVSGGPQDAEPLTRFENQDVMGFDVTPDGKTAVMHRWDTLYSLDLTDPNAVPRPIALNAPEDAQDDEKLISVSNKATEAAQNPDGNSIAVVAYGDIFVRGTDKEATARRITKTPGREKDIAWSPDGTQLYFVSDDDGTESIMVARVERTRGELKKAYEDATGTGEEEEEKEEGDTKEEDAKEEPAQDPVSGEWTLELEVPETGPTTIEFTLELGKEGKVTGNFSAPDFQGEFTGAFEAETGKLEGECTIFDREKAQLEVTIDGENMTGHVTRSEGRGILPIEGTRNTPEKAEEEKEEEDDPALDPKRWSEALTFHVEPFLVTESNDHTPKPSPDGMKLAFTRGNGNLMILDLATREEKMLREGWDRWYEYEWSPDSHWIAFDQSDRNFNQDIFIVPADGSADPVNITRHPDNDGAPRFNADGKILAFQSNRKGDESDIWFVFLDESLSGKPEPELKEYFKELTDAAKKRKPLKAKDVQEALAKSAEAEDKDESEEDYKAPFTEEDLQSAYLRLERVTSLPGSERDVVVLPSGEKIIFTSSGGSPGSSGLYSISHDGTGRKKLGDSVSIEGISLDGGKLTAIGSGQAKLIDSSSGKSESMVISDRVRVDLREQSAAKFREAARIMGATFYHPTMKDLDWEELSSQYEDLATGAHTADEFNWVANRYLGELNASHLGVRAPSTSMPLSQSQGRLGTIHEPVEGGYMVTGVIPESAAQRSLMPLQVGDVITGLDFESFEEGEFPLDTIESRLKGKSGKEVVVSVRREVEGEPEAMDLELLITPQSWSSIRMLLYKQMQRKNAALVEEWSDGRLGYAHIRGMSQSSLDEFERDLFAATEGRDGLIVDVRNNGGGWTADRLLGSLMAQPHAYTVPRGADPSMTTGYPQDRLFIQRYTLPVNMLCNEKSFSNAEIVSHAFKTLDRGTLVGQQTYGGVISTGGTSLIDGTSVRLPFRGWYLPDGTDMENNGAIPDIVVEQTPEDESRSHDAQLQSAVEDLMTRLDKE